MTRLIAGIAAGSILVLSIFVGLQARAFPSLPDGHPGPGLFPGVVAIGLFVCGLLLAVRAVRGGSADPAASRAEPPEVPAIESRRGGALRIIGVLVALGMFPSLVGLAGFVPTVAALAFLIALLLEARPIPAAVTALAGTGLVYLLFTRLLGVPL